VTINDPANRVQIDSNEVKVAGKIVSLNDIKKIEILINNEVKETIENSKKFEKIFSLDKGTYKIKVRAFDNQGNQGEREAEIGVQVPWDWQPTPTPSPSP